jgi:hypothetical protein
MKYALAALILVVGLITEANAQSSQVLVQPLGSGWTIAAPGRVPLLVQPMGSSTYSIGVPGQVPSIATPFGNGYIVTPPMVASPIVPIAPIPPIGGY